MGIKLTKEGKDLLSELYAKIKNPCTRLVLRKIK